MIYKFIGTVGEARGLIGEAEVYDVPAGILGIDNRSNVKIGFTESFSELYSIISLKKKNNRFFVKFHGFNTPESLSVFLGKGIFVNEESILFDKDTYYVEDLIACTVFDFNSGDEIGILADVMILPANDVWMVKTKQGELPVPVIDSVIKKVDIASKRIEIALIDGLMDLLEIKSDKDEYSDKDEN